MNLSEEYSALDSKKATVKVFKNNFDVRVVILII